MFSLPFSLKPIENADQLKVENLPGAIEAASVEDDLYAYPLTADNGYFLYYNKQYFNQEDVKTFDRILQIAAENEKRVTMDWSSAWYVYAFFGNTGLEVGLNDDGITNYLQPASLWAANVILKFASALYSS